MSRFNVLMQSKFMGCMVIGLGRDEGRKRHVVLYALPDDEVHVGIHDGIDSWIGNAASNPFGLDAAKRLREIADGRVFEIEQGQTFRRFEDGTYQREEGAPRARRRLGGAIPALPLPIVPVASPLASAVRERKRIGMTAGELLGKPIKERRRVSL